VQAARSVRVDATTLPTLLSRGFLHSSAYVRVELDAPELTAVERDHWRSRLERSYNACGCELGAAALVAAVPLLAAVFAIRPAGLSLLRPLGVVLLVATPLTAAFLGKLVGVLRARRALRSSVHELSSLLAARTA
jgi:hypothetical protein